MSKLSLCPADWLATANALEVMISLTPLKLRRAIFSNLAPMLNALKIPPAVIQAWMADQRLSPAQPLTLPPKNTVVDISAPMLEQFQATARILPKATRQYGADALTTIYATLGGADPARFKQELATDRRGAYKKAATTAAYDFMVMLTYPPDSFPDPSKDLYPLALGTPISFADVVPHLGSTWEGHQLKLARKLLAERRCGGPAGLPTAIRLKLLGGPAEKLSRPVHISPAL